MKYLFHIILLIGVVLIGFQTSFAENEEKDRKSISTDTIPSLKKTSIDTSIKVDPIDVGDTLVFDDFDEDDAGLTVQFSLDYLVVRECHYPPDAQIKILPTKDVTEQDLVESKEFSAESAIVLMSPATIDVYPNPATAQSSEIHIQHNFSQEISVTILDASGRIVMIQNSLDSVLTFKLAEPGVYIVVLSSGQEQRTARLLVN